MSNVQDRKQTNRILGVDLAKVVAMIFVVAVHVAGFGVQPVSQGGNVLHALTYPLFMTCINIFGIASGYVGVKTSVTFARMVKMWLQVVVSGLMVLLALGVFSNVPLSAKDWIGACTPIASSQYWYISAYFLLMIVMPILNAGISAIQGRHLILFAIFICISGCSLCAPSRFFDVLGLNEGYSFGWLVILYVVGACFREHAHPVLTKNWLWIGAALPILCVGSVSVVSILADISCLRSLAVRSYQYTSPFILLSSCAIFLLCIRTKMNNNLCLKLITLLSSTSLGVYLLHCQPVLARLQRVHKGFFRAENAIEWILGLIGMTALVYFSCTLIDLARMKAFKMVVTLHKRALNGRTLIHKQ